MWQSHAGYLNSLFGVGWQDYVLAVGTWIFLIALIPSIASKDKPALSSSLLTAGILYVFCFTYATLGLTHSVIASAAVATGWAVLAWQKWRMR